MICGVVLRNASTCDNCSIAENSSCRGVVHYTPNLDLQFHQFLAQQVYNGFSSSGRPYTLLVISFHFVCTVLQILCLYVPYTLSCVTCVNNLWDFIPFTASVSCVVLFLLREDDLLPALTLINYVSLSFSLFVSCFPNLVYQ